MTKLRLLAAAAVLAAGMFAAPADAAPTHNETALSLFSCAATRPDPDGAGPYTGGDMTVNHSHYIASKSSPGHWDWYDCEDYLPGSTNGCVWAVYYIYDNNIGIFGPFNITCYGF